MSNPLALIIEDDPKLGQIFSLTLQADFTTEICPDGREALARLAQVVPALVVLDLHLPGASGEEILASIRADPRLAGTRVILSTANHLQADLLEEQADVVLLKPVSPTQLRELANRLCK
jgi:CheY-like chemotaxis protein